MGWYASECPSKDMAARRTLSDSLCSPWTGRPCKRLTRMTSALPIGDRHMAARKLFYFCAGVFLLVLLWLPTASIVGAQVFHDDFDGNALESTKWNVAGGGVISVAGGTATLSAPCGQFPYVTTLNTPFPATATS